MSETKWIITQVRPDSPTFASFFIAIESALAYSGDKGYRRGLVFQHEAADKWSKLSDVSKKDLVIFAHKKNSTLFVQTSSPWLPSSLEWSRNLCSWLRSNRISNVIIDFSTLCPPASVDTKGNREWIRRVTGILRKANCVKSLGGYYIPSQTNYTSCDWSAVFQELASLDFFVANESVSTRAVFKNKLIAPASVPSALTTADAAPTKDIGHTSSSSSGSSALSSSFVLGRSLGFSVAKSRDQNEAEQLRVQMCTAVTNYCNATGSTTCSNGVVATAASLGHQLRRVLGFVLFLLLIVSLYSTLTSQNNAAAGLGMLSHQAINGNGKTNINWAQVYASLYRTCDSPLIPDQLCLMLPPPGALG